VVEKPVAGTAADAVLLAEEAEKCARQVHVFHNRRWDSDFLTLRELKDSGIIGDLQVMESRLESLRPIRSTSWRNSPHPQDLGGVIIDLGSHLVDQALQLMGPVKTVFANAHSVRLGAKAEDYFSMFLVHEDTSTSLLVASKATPSMDFRFKVLGSRAIVRVGCADSQELALRTGMNPAAESWGEEPASAMVQVFSLNSEGDYLEGFLPMKRGRWNIFYSKVRDAILKNTSAPVALHDAIETLRVLDAARISATTGATIPLVPPAQHGLASEL
jgi:predicted dehydrogenase